MTQGGDHMTTQNRHRAANSGRNMTDLYRAGMHGDWQVVQILGHMSDGRPILREIGRPFCGVWIAEVWQIARAA